jgi:hypothetical protein
LGGNVFAEQSTDGTIAASDATAGTLTAIVEPIKALRAMTLAINLTRLRPCTFQPPF